MAVNADAQEQWADDVEMSVRMYNRWYMNFGPVAYEQVRETIAGDLETTLAATNAFRDIEGEVLRETAEMVDILRQSTAPPLAVDRLRGLAPARVTRNTMEKFEEGRMPPMMDEDMRRKVTDAIADVVREMLDPDLFPWVRNGGRDPTDEELNRATTAVIERLTGSKADSLIRNRQEERQIEKISAWLDPRDYHEVGVPGERGLRNMDPGTYTLRPNVKGGEDGGVNIPVDVAIQPANVEPPDFPHLVEAKSAGDFVNVNKRRKEEAEKLVNLRARHGDDVLYILFLGGYFGPKYLEHVARSGLDWVWEHRVEDFSEFGL